MELEEMKTLWNQVSAEMDKQKRLTDSLVIKMTQLRYSNKLSKIMVPETIASLVAMAGVIYILFNFHKLNTWYLAACGIVAVLILGVLPFFSLRAIRRMRMVNIANNNYKQSLLQYSKSRMQFVFVQKLSLYLGAVLLVVTLPVATVLIGGKDPFLKTGFYIYYAIMFPLFYAVSRRVFKCYVNITADAGNILKELDNETLTQN